MRTLAFVPSMPQTLRSYSFLASSIEVSTRGTTKSVPASLTRTTSIPPVRFLMACARCSLPCCSTSVSSSWILSATGTCLAPFPSCSPTLTSKLARGRFRRSHHVGRGIAALTLSRFVNKCRPTKHSPVLRISDSVNQSPGQGSPNTPFQSSA